MGLNSELLLLANAFQISLVGVDGDRSRLGRFAVVAIIEAAKKQLASLVDANEVVGGISGPVSRSATILTGDVTGNIYAPIFDATVNVVISLANGVRRGKQKENLLEDIIEFK